MNYKRSSSPGPDPISRKAFLSEYTAGYKRSEDSEKASYQDLELLQDTVGAAALEIETRCRKIRAICQSGNLKVNEIRLANALSEQLSTLFYSLGRLDGAKSNED